MKFTHLIDKTCYCILYYRQTIHMKNWYKIKVMLNENFRKNNKERFLGNLQ